VSALALVTASAAPWDRLTLPLAGLGLLLGLIGGGVGVASGRGGLVWPTLGSALGLAVLLVALLWPGLFNPLRAGGGSDNDRITPVPLGHAIANPAALQEDGWTDASRAAVQQDDVRVHVASVSVAAVSSQGKGKPSAHGESYLLVRVVVQNVGARRHLLCEPWGGPSEDGRRHLCRLTDRAGHGYTLKSLDPAGAGGKRGKGVLVGPGRSADEVLVFELPPAGEEVLHLELSAVACGGSGTFRLSMPRSMVRR
jgi:hypothetical protein